MIAAGVLAARRRRRRRGWDACKSARVRAYAWKRLAPMRSSSRRNLGDRGRGHRVPIGRSWSPRHRAARSLSSPRRSPQSANMTSALGSTAMKYTATKNPPAFHEAMLGSAIQLSVLGYLWVQHRERRGVPDVAARVPVRPRRGGPVGPAGRAHRLPVHLLLDLLGAQPHGGGRLRPVDRRPAVVDPAGGVHAALVRRAAVAPRRADVRAHAHVGPPPHVQLCAQGRLLGRRGLPLGRDPQVVQRAGLEVGGLQPRLHLLRPAGAPPPPPPPPPARPRRPHAFAPSLRRNR